MLSVRSPFPAFQLTACVSRSPKRAFRTLTHESFSGSWIVYFFWPNDFTPICHSEIAALAGMVNEFAERDTKIVGCSVDSAFAHFAWLGEPGSPDEDLPFPMLSDARRELTQMLGILDPKEEVALRATLIVDPSHTIRHLAVNDFSVGRNPRELLRILDALQTDELCPANWTKGGPTVEASASFQDESFGILDLNGKITRNARPGWVKSALQAVNNGALRQIAVTIAGGRSILLTDYIGEVILLAFITRRDCGAVHFVEDLGRLAQEYGPRGFVPFVAVLDVPSDEDVFQGRPFPFPFGTIRRRL